jgi:hypothetical protein
LADARHETPLTAVDLLNDRMIPLFTDDDTRRVLGRHAGLADLE